MVRKTSRVHASVAALMACALFLASCSTNPATGKHQLAFIGEDQEIAMGREAAQQAAQSIGLYQDDQLQAYVSRVGKQLAANSERPNLPWTFQVVDDPSVNAFALPGGFIFVTRGLLTHLTSEAELASVVGHEIGHVTARHSVEQMSKAQLAQIGLIAGMVLRPELANYGDLAQTGLQLLFLKYSRDDESQADDLGLRYMVRGNYDAREMPQVFETLRRVSQKESQGGRVPNWLLTHPTEEARIQRIGSEVAKLNRDFSNATVGRESYLRSVDNVVFGQNPREGYFRGNTFIHPELGFQIQFPQGWKTSNQKQTVGAISPREDAVVVVTLSDSSSPQQAAQQFFSQQGIVQGQSLQGSGMPAVTRTFGVQRGQSGDLEGVATFVEHGNRVYQILGYTLANRWSGYNNDLQSALASFSQVSDRRLLSVEPQRLDIVTLPNAMTLQEFASRYPSSVDLQTLAIINQAEPGTRFPAGTEVKRVVGERAA
ncbi:MAG TPA: M48 family metalloprotease [Thermoanaerobaculia bacterium]|nr:M48 family metalloprotease [Thermoanaerobaculia bacterium]